jgi:hypothetical protein
MLRFLMGVLVVGIGVAAWTLSTTPDIFGPQTPAWWLVAMLVALPVGAAWAVSEAVDRWSPRRVFDWRLRGMARGAALFAGGAVSAVTGYVLATVMLAVVEWMPDGAVISLSTASTCAVVLLVCFGRARPGACVHCLYELGDGQPRCPECGAIGSRVGVRAQAAGV